MEVQEITSCPDLSYANKDDAMQESPEARSCNSEGLLIPVPGAERTIDRKLSTGTNESCPPSPKKMKDPLQRNVSDVSF